MGRTDLARFRKTAPSVTPAAVFPQHVRHLLKNLSSYPHKRAAHAIRSLNDASSQSAQVSSIRLLGVILHDHLQENQSCDHAEDNSVSGRQEGHLTPCQLVTPVLFAFLFNAPDAIPGLISASLRALLRLLPFQISSIQLEFDSFFQSIEQTAASLPTSSSEKILPDTLSCCINSLAVMLSEQQSKRWIFNHSDRIRAVLSIACYVTDVFVLTSDPSAKPTRDSEHQINTNLVKGACDAAMKAMQDIINSFFTGDIEMDENMVSSAIPQCVKCCHDLLQLPSTPRSCSLACSISFVTGRLILKCKDYSDADSLVATLQDDLLSELKSFPSFSQLSVLRAMMEAPITKPALSVLLFPPKTADVSQVQSAEKNIFSLLTSLTSTSADVHFRFLSMETIITCVRRVRSPDRLSDGSRDAVLSLVYQRWEEPFAGVTSQIRETMQALVEACGNNKSSLAFWCQMTKSLVKGDWRSKGMYAPLCVLVSKVGSRFILEIEPKCEELAMNAMGGDSRLTKAVSDWLDALWTSVKRECDKGIDQFVSLTAEPVVKALLHQHNRALRERVAEHILPVYMKSSDRQSVREIGRRLLQWLSSEDVEDEGQIRKQRKRACRVRGAVMVMSVARKQGVSLGEFTDSVVRRLLIDALCSKEEDLRTSAFELVVTSSVPTEPISQAELDLVLYFLPIALMPGGAPADRSRFRNSMRRFFERFAACRRAASDSCGGWWNRERKKKYGGTQAPELEIQRLALLDRLRVFEGKCINSLFACAHPGASFSRRTAAMEIIKLFISNLGSDALHAQSDKRSCSTIALITGLLDEWERPRRASLEVVQAIPAPIPGVSLAIEAQALLKVATPLLNSVRQKDADSGGAVFRVVFQKYITQLPLTEIRNGQALSFDGSVSTKAKKAPTSPALCYAMTVLDSVQGLISLAETDFSSACARGLFHGRFLTLRYLVQDFPWKQHLSVDLQKPLNEFICRFLTLAEKCIRIALEGVSFKKFNDEIASDSMHLDSHETTETGPTAPSLQYSDGDAEANGDANGERIFLGQDRQLESTACFQSAKEICVALGVLCHQAPICDVPEGGKTSSDHFLGQANIERIGRFYTFVFTGTRHWGVIDGASEGLQLLCERLLSSSSLSLRMLPSQWAMSILNRALGGELYVLRRSAGIPWLICAIVNAEASVNRRSYESPALNEITSALLEHMHHSNENERNNVRTKSGSKPFGEDAASHALNLLTALFLNSNIGSNVLKYLESAAICCIDSFCSTSWLVRNSAMRLYSALIRRGIGVCRERKSEDDSFSTTSTSSFKAVGGTSATLDGVRRLNGTTAFQFFSRHPKLHPFLLERLQTVLDQEQDRGIGVDHPILYPVLYLLSCLSPNTNEDPSTQISMAKFWDVARTCVHWRTDYVRRAAAGACVALIDECTQVPEIIRSILQNLPKQPIETTVPQLQNGTNGFNGTEMERHPAHLRQNWLHGELLMIAAILRNTIDIMRDSDKRRLATVLEETLPETLWIATEGLKNVCSVTRGCMVDILVFACQLGNDCENKVLMTLCEVASRQVVRNDSRECGVLSQIGITAFRIKAVRFYGDVIGKKYLGGRCSLNEAVESITLVLESPDEEEEGINACLEICCSLLASGKEIEKLSDKVLGRLWKVVGRLTCEQRRSESVVSALTLWACLLDLTAYKDQLGPVVSDRLEQTFDLAEQHPCVDVQERALVVLGGLVTDWAVCDEASVLRWMRLIVKSAWSQASSLRIAACLSFAKSLCHRSSGDEKKIRSDFVAQGYITLTHLLEDDANDVRKHCLNIAQRCVLPQHIDPADRVDGHVLPTMMRIYATLSDSYANTATLFRHLKLTLGTGAEDDKLMVAVQHVVGVGVQSDDGTGTGTDTSWLDGVADELDGDDVEKQLLDEQSAGRAGEGGDDDRLFRLEQACGDGEIILQMQLLAWCFRRIFSKRQTDSQRITHIPCAPTKVVHPDTYSHNSPLAASFSMKDLWTSVMDDFETELVSVCDSDSSTPIAIDGGMFSKQGFTAVSRMCMRAFLCLALLDFVATADESPHARDRLRSIAERWSGQMHPVIRQCLQGLVKTDIDAEHSPSGIGDGRVLFILPPEGFDVD